jgi:hypothetical protein
MDDTLMSLYDYLGKAAGKDLGKAVHIVAVNNKIPYSTRQVSNPKYEGLVMLYPKWFLDEYFKKEDKNDSLPF